MRRRIGVLAAVVCIAVLMLTFGLPTAAARGTGNSTMANWGGHTIVVWPNGYNDTADLQAAFNVCTTHSWTCTIQLVKGTYYTDQITAYGFQGRFVGAGQGRTVIQALPNLPPPAPAYNTPSSPFWAGAPGPSNPWPVLLTFVNGTFSISGMTINELYANPIASPGWYEPTEIGDGNLTALYAVILVTGEQASASVSWVTVNGAGGDLSIPVGTPSTFNLDSSIAYMGMFLPAGWSDPFADQIPVSGTFALTDSVLYWSDSAFYFENLLDATVVVASNSISSTPLPAFVDVSNTQLHFVWNSFTNVMVGAAPIGEQSVYKTNLLPSTVYVIGNYVATNWGGSGPVMADFGTPSTLSAVMTGNTVVTDTSCGCYNPSYPAMGAVYADVSQASSSFLVSRNTILGGGGGVVLERGPNTVVSDNYITGAMAGVLLGCYPVPSACVPTWGFETNATGVLVTGNVIKNSGQYGIAVVADSSYNWVTWNYITGTASGGYDLYWDGTGTGNVWFGNFCGDHTSSPPGLC